jgi:glycerol-3-phosphate acyltransferase PlsY
VWLLIAFATRYSSLAALVASLASLALLVLMNEWRLAVLSLVLTVLLYIRHAANIGRLARGEEARIGESRP